MMDLLSSSSVSGLLYARKRHVVHNGALASLAELHPNVPSPTSHITSQRIVNKDFFVDHPDPIIVCGRDGAGGS